MTWNAGSDAACCRSSAASTPPPRRCPPLRWRPRPRRRIRPEPRPALASHGHRPSAAAVLLDPALCLRVDFARIAPRRRDRRGPPDADGFQPLLKAPPPPGVTRLGGGPRHQTGGFPREARTAASATARLPPPAAC